MNESILTTIKILGMLFLIYKFINLAAHLSDTDEVRSVMGKSFSIRAGNFLAK